MDINNGYILWLLLYELAIYELFMDPQHWKEAYAYIPMLPTQTHNTKDSCK